MGGTQCSPTVHKNHMPAICGWYLPVCAFTAGLRVQHGGGKLGNCPCSLSVGSLPGQAVFLASCCLHMFPLLCPHKTPFWLHCWDDPLMELQYYSLSTDSLHPTGIKSGPWALSISCYFLQVFSLSLRVINTLDVVLSSTPYGVSQRALGAALLLRSSLWGESCFSSFRGSRMYREDVMFLQIQLPRKGVWKSTAEEGTISKIIPVAILLFHGIHGGQWY